MNSDNNSSVWFFFRITLAILCIGFQSCQEKAFDLDVQFPDEASILNKDTDTSIFITKDIIIIDKGPSRDSLFSYVKFEKFLESLISSGRFKFVPLKDLATTTSNDKVIIALRHDIDYDIASSVRFARREYELGIKGTYYVLHSAEYYTRMPEELSYYKDVNSQFLRKSSVLEYLKKIQNEYGHEIGWHNDLVTLQVHYNINSGDYLRKELKWLRENNINITGTSSHGSQYCYIYHYLNGFFWKEYGASKFFYNYEYITCNNKLMKIDKYTLSDFGFDYEADLLRRSLFYADVFRYNNKRWHMNMVNWNSLKPGDKVILLFHPALWDSF